MVEKKDLDKAIADFAEAIRLDPKVTDAYHHRGNAWLQKPDYEKAIADFSEEIQLDADRSAAWLNRGYVWLTKKENEKAIEDLSRSIELDATSPMAFFYRGRAFYFKGERRKAIGDFSEAIDLGMGSYAYYDRGVAFYEVGDFEQAIEDFTHAIDRGLDDAVVYSAAAWPISTKASWPTRFGTNRWPFRSSRSNRSTGTGGETPGPPPRNIRKRSRITIRLSTWTKNIHPPWSLAAWSLGTWSNTTRPGMISEPPKRWPPMILRRTKRAGLVSGNVPKYQLSQGG